MSTYNVSENFRRFTGARWTPAIGHWEAVVSPQQEQRQSEEGLGVLVNTGSAPCTPTPSPHALLPQRKVLATLASEGDKARCRGQAQSSTGFPTWTSGGPPGIPRGWGPSTSPSRTPSLTLALSQALSQGSETDEAPDVSGGSLKFLTVNPKIPPGEWGRSCVKGLRTLLCTKHWR